ncbi:M23 family metallopeptidase [Qipengyuania sp. XHP0207]|uniref:M23 family metallopeptidase n=1 Tax=Qipengyuania sp. XHP0207 TaxID=3038078 RepID=UPI00241FFD4D|nr:M23 family metallopeptidase [Qipengyuania sp. XHP0207]MDG5749187.1 M23 family metallopeptidase [Qipengyuania sp. XHP0207]
MKRLALALSAFLLVAAGNPATKTEHTVAEGETLSGIAERVGVSATVIAAANGLVEPFDVRAGQVLIIPRQRKHVVKAGDTGSGIAQKYGVPFDLIAVANGLEAPYRIRRGQTLIIPAYSDRPAPPAPVRDRPYFRRPHDGAILAGFARRPDGGGHEGIDIAVSTGDMVRASASGTVVYAQEDSGRFGPLVVLDHGNGWRTRYGHLARTTVTLGEFVKAGERIGIAGQGGSATRPELHFDILKDNTPVDPADLLPARGRP